MRFSNGSIPNHEKNYVSSEKEAKIHPKNKKTQVKFKKP
jgi:hypothetical protein